MITVPGPVTVPSAGVRPGTWYVPDDGLSSRSARARGSGPYEASLPARLAGLELALPGDLAADVGDAEAALAAFDAHSTSALGTDNPALGPMSAVLLRTESASSSQIEDLTVGAKQLALAELHQSRSANARAVVANVRTMEAALRLASDLDLDALLSMHRELMTDAAVGSGRSGPTGDAGSLRTRLVWVGRSGSSPRGAVHVAPEAEDVPPAMADLIHFIARDDLPVLLHAALAHAQFETIHPFTDGNGRTGRALVHAMLRGKGLLRSTTAPVSAGLLTDLDGYVSALTAFRTGDARPIIEQFAHAARYAATTGSRLVDDLAAVLAHSRNLMTGMRRQATGWKVLPLLIAQPIVDSAFVRDRLGVSAMTAQRALDQLTDAGVLRETTGFSRNRVWQQGEILAVLDGYAATVRRDG
ncbi:Fic family protein [Brachybacterium muris]|uniref:Fic family protein n=1 Tax=Brachybacterium muris TaxID=219301 RepID=UPI0019576B33|nr:Fic family protein [Brachybacterium muris]MBM7500853.1 Fic family protein [Brachybacterium muris]MCT2177324.1 Fic family protein [Brachybacterium muris]MCT2260772.1 Fic family protein [Brachybacterium muris]